MPPIETIISLVIALAALLFTALSFRRTSNQDTASDATDRATMTADIRYIRNSIDDIKLDSGFVTDLTAPANSSNTYTVNFNHAFATTPNVSTSLYRSYGTAEVLASIAILVISISTTSFTVQVSTSGSADLSHIGVRWVAVSA